MNFTNKSNLIKFSTGTLTKLILGVSLSFLTLPADKVSANMAPAMFNFTGTIPVSFNECKNRVHKTANLLFRRVANKWGDDNGNLYFMTVQTGNIVGVIQCSRHTKGSSYMVVTSSKYYTSNAEAQSLSNRMANVMSGRI